MVLSAKTIDPFLAIARELESRWAAREHDERHFAELATEVLAARALHREVSADDILAWVLAADRIPDQFDLESKFGQPPITLVRTSRFVIDALFWLEGTTEIHQHGFSGAFQVLAGSSVHSRYDWTLRDRVNTAILIGDTKFRGFELLGPGDTRAIGAGRELIHGLFHLERPSVTIVVRTLGDREAGPQYTYHAPHIATDPLVRDPLLQRKLEALAVLAALGRDHQSAFAAQLFEADFYTVFRLGRHYMEQVGDLSKLRELLESARSRHGERIDALPAVFDEMLRTSAIVTKRERLIGADHRFFLAMLLVLPTRAAILDAIAQRYRGDPVQHVVGWIEDLATALGGDAISDHSSIVLREMLRGHTGDRLLERLEADFDIGDVRDDIRALERQLRRTTTLRSLLA